MAYVFALMRSVVHLLWMLIAVIPFAFLMVLATPFVNAHTMFGFAKGFLTCAMVGLRVICGVSWRVKGLENLPGLDANGQPLSAILLLKHQSTLETFLMPLIMPRPLAYVFKKELLYVPFFGWGIGRCDMIHIDRKQGKQAFTKVVEQGKRILGQGTWVIMFPEGTRIPRGQVGQYKLGGTRLAVATGAPVVPIAVASAKFWPRRGLVKYPGVVDVVIGKPIDSVGREPDELMREVQTWIEAQMRELDPSAYAAGEVAPVSDPVPAPGAQAQ
jgi:1-acyl-sn-glycerol-3-phosphate acyltransferase